MNAAADLHQTANLTITSRVRSTNWLNGLATAADNGNAEPLRTDVTCNCSAAAK